MNDLYNVSTSPHIRQKISTRKIMLDVIIALLPTTVFGIMHFGFRSLFVIVGTVVASIVAEWLYCKILKRPQTIDDLSCIVTGLILALNMPSDIPIWIPILGAFFAIIVVKELFGGLGQNFMNPALAARCFLLISFASAMTNFTIDGVSTATPLFVIKESVNLETENIASNMVVDLKNSFIGYIPGTIGEVSKVCLIIGGIYLLVRQVIKPRIPLTLLVTFAICMALFGKQKLDLSYVLLEVCNGGLIFGSIFMATDYVTSPVTPKGQIIFAMFIGFIAAIFRVFGSSCEGLSFAILLGNVLVPIIEKYTLPKAFGREE